MTSPEKPQRRRRKKPSPEKGEAMDLTTGKFSMDLKTGLLLLALVAQWYDGRTQAEKQAAIQEAQNKATAETLSEVKRLQNLQQYDINNIKVQLAEAGIKQKKGD